MSKYHFTGNLLKYPDWKQKQDEIWKIHLLELDQFKISFSSLTIPFLVDEPEFNVKYTNLRVELTRFYHGWNINNFGQISHKDLLSGEVKYGVVYWSNYKTTGTGYNRYLRVQIDQRFHSDLIDYRIYINFNNFPCLFLTCLDTGRTFIFNPSSMKLFHLIPRFCQIERRINLLYIEHTQTLVNIMEFRTAFYRFAMDNNARFQAKLKYNDEENITIAELVDPQLTYEDILIRTIETFEPIKEPPLGKKFTHCRFSHIDPNGTVYFQYTLGHQYKLFYDLSQKLSPETISQVKSNGPYEFGLNKSCIALAEFEGWYYRCLIDEESKPEDHGYTVGPEEVFIFFMDYGNRAVCKMDELIPCADVCKPFSFFPRQAFRAKLNVENVKSDDVLASYPEFVNIRTIEQGSISNEFVPIIEVLKFCGKKRRNVIALYGADDPKDKNPDCKPEVNVVDLMVANRHADKVCESIIPSSPITDVRGKIAIFSSYIEKFKVKTPEYGLRDSGNVSPS